MSRLETALAFSFGLGEHVIVDVENDLGSLSAGGRVETGFESSLRQLHQRVGSPLCVRGLLGYVWSDLAGQGLFLAAEEHLLRMVQGFAQRFPLLRIEAPADDEHAVFVGVGAELATLVPLVRLLSLGHSVDSAVGADDPLDVRGGAVES